MDDVTSYLGQALLNVDIRPVRAGYVVRTDSKDDFVRAVGFASSRWGGIQEPIVPVSATGRRVGEAWKELLSILDPDILVNVAGLAGEDLRRVERSLGRPLTHSYSFDRGQDDGLHELSAYAADDLARLIVTQPASSDVATIAATGIIRPPDGIAGWDEMGVRVFPEADPMRLAEAQLSERTIIASTANQVRDVEAEGLAYPSVVWVSRPNSLRNAIWFWNIRALQPRVVGAPPMVLTTMKVVRSGYVNSGILSRVGANRYAYSRPDVLCLGLEAKDSELHEIGSILGLTLYTETSVGSHGSSSPRDFSANPLTYLTRMDPRGWVTGSRKPGTRATAVVQLTRPKITVRTDSPIVFNSRSHGFVRMRLSGPPELDLPRRPGVARLFDPNASWKHDGLEMMLMSQPAYSLDLGFPEQVDILAAAVADSGNRAELSSAGSYAMGVIALAGGSDAFGTVDVIAVIRALTTPRSRELLKALGSLNLAASDDQLRALAAEFGGQARPLFSSLVEVSSRTPGVGRRHAAQILEQLVDRLAVRRGFKVACKLCGLRSFMETAMATPRPSCPGCGARASYVLESKSGEPSQHYQLNALLDVASENGVLAHLFAMRALEKREPGSYLLPGANIYRVSDGVHLGEVDLLGLSGRQVIAGEVKTSAGAFVEDAMKHHADLSYAVGADRHIMVCLEPLDGAVISQAEAICRSKGMALTVVTGPVA